MLTFSDYFTLDVGSYSGITIYVFDHSKEAQFVCDCIETYRQAYVSDEDLNERVAETGHSRPEEIALLLPTKPNLKSGEFSEILAYTMLHQVVYGNANLYPPKWRWKEGPDFACHFADLIFLKCDDVANPSKQDYIATAEVKSGVSEPTKKGSRIKDAIEGANEDRVGRFARTIAYLSIQYRRDKKYTEAKIVDRFKNPVNVTYTKHYNAIAIVEKAYLNAHVGNVNQSTLQAANGNNIAIYVLPMDNLKGVYESVYSQLPNS